MNSRRFTASAPRGYGGKVSTAVLRCGISIWPMSLMDQTRPFDEVGSMSGLPESGQDWAIYEYAT
jgi:hypothetical protein